MLNTNQISRLREAAQSALICERSTGVPCELTICQWALESGWGSRQPGNNCFGIKNYIGSAGYQLLTTKEWFTLSQVTQWQRDNPVRSAKPVEGAVSVMGRTEYECQDSFALFPTLTDCFLKHSELLTKGLYANFLGTFKSGGDLPTYVQNVSRIYATDPNYCVNILAILHMQEVIAALKEIRGESHMGAVGE